MLADIPAPSEFVTKLEKIVRKENLVPDQIYNFDENWLNFKRLPQNKFFVGNSSSAPGLKLNKVRITVALCFLNAPGSHKIQFLVPYWKSSKTKSIKNHECLITLDVFYCAQ